ncbi:MAG: pantoate--beta-alanine ligase [Bacteroidetes bacterium]|nr:pantoate--beta-alanine ligase [Bacteroidota bacterium]
MKVFKSPEVLHSELKKIKLSGNKIGFVPTMGALHFGHLSLVKRARLENVTVVCSIFVNPKQFNDSNDLNRYPRPIENDMKLLIEANVDYLFLPDVDDLYNENYIDEEVPLNNLDKVLEGAQRPGHFQGVAKVVKRFFEIVEPDTAYFGQKDFQQTVVVKHLRNLFFPEIEIVVCPIERESNGLAMSSRNIRLDNEHRSKATFIYQSLLQLRERCHFKPLHQALELTRKYLNSREDTVLEYLEAVDGNTMEIVNVLSDTSYIVAVIVVQYGGVRLLDNIVLKE